MEDDPSRLTTAWMDPTISLSLFSISLVKETIPEIASSLSSPQQAYILLIDQTEDEARVQREGTRYIRAQTTTNQEPQLRTGTGQAAKAASVRSLPIFQASRPKPKAAAESIKTSMFMPSAKAGSKATSASSRDPSNPWSR
jgi:hypothetical protein